MQCSYESQVQFNKTFLLFNVAKAMEKVEASGNTKLETTISLLIIHLHKKKHDYIYYWLRSIIRIRVFQNAIRTIHNGF